MPDGTPAISRAMPDARAEVRPDGTVLLYGVLGDQADGLGSGELVKAIRALTVDTIRVHINSPGGFVTEGVAIFNALKQHPARVVVTIDALAASMASAVAMAGDEIVMPANAVMMIHNPWTGSVGDAEQLRKDAEALDKMAASLVTIYADRSGLSEQEVVAIMDQETWLAAEEAVEMGFADRVAGDAPADNFAAVDVAQLPTMPTAMSRRFVASASKGTNQPAVAALTTAQIGELVKATAGDLPSPQRAALMSDLLKREGGVTDAQARAAVVDALAAWSDSQGGPAINAHRVDVGESWDDPERIRGRMVGALTARLTGASPADEAREFMGASLVDMIRGLLEARGERCRWLDRTKLIKAAITHTTSDFPMLLEETGNRILLEAYEAARSPLLMISRERNASDFRPISTLKFGEHPELLKVDEAGEIRYGTTSEAKETFSLQTFGRLFSLTRQAIVNDDLDAFSRWNARAGIAAANKQADLMVGLLSANSYAGVTTDDGNPLFDASHNNLAAAGGAIAVATLDEARQAMRLQTALDGTTLISVAPRWLLVGAQNETVGEQVLATLNAQTVAEQNPFAQRLELLVEPRIEAANWYLIGDTRRIEAPLQHAYLDGASAPQIETEPGFEVLGLKTRVVLDFGVGPGEFRAAYRNPGA